MSIRVEKVKEVTRLIREARRRWDAHENRACRRMREQALLGYDELSQEERQEIPEKHRVWLRYRSEKYFGAHRTRPAGRAGVLIKEKKKSHAPAHSVGHKKIESPVGSLCLLASKKGLSGVYFGHRIEKTTLPPEEKENRILKKVDQQLQEYFQGTRREFDLPLDAKGSQFQRSIWRELSKIPFGETRSYSELADAIGNPQAVRAVGLANGANPISIVVPCHRVIGKNGKLVGFGGGLEIKTCLLRHEGKLL